MGKGVDVGKGVGVAVVVGAAVHVGKGVAIHVIVGAGVGVGKCVFGCSGIRSYSWCLCRKRCRC